MNKNEGFLLYLLRTLNDTNSRAVLLQSFIAENGPLSEPTAAVVRELLAGKESK